MENNNKQLNDVTLNKLKMGIFHMIRENHKTKKLTSTQLNEKIRKRIEVLVDNDN